jgi:hypothetical protein
MSSLLVFNRVYRMEIQSVTCWYFRPNFVNYCPSNLLSGSPQNATFGTHSFETWNIEPLFWTLKIFNENMHVHCAIVLVYSAEWKLKHEFYQSLKDTLKDIVRPKKRGGQEIFQSIRPAFLHNRRYLFWTIKGILSCFNLNKPVSSFRVFFDVEFATKNSETH